MTDRPPRRRKYRWLSIPEFAIASSRAMTGNLQPVLRHLSRCHHSNGGHGNAVSLPQNNQSDSMKDVTIARLIVGTRHCRVLTVGNINSDATGLEIGQKYRSQFKQVERL